MAIIDSELQFFKSAVVTDTTSNGSVMSANLIPTNVQQNVFPHVFKAERDAGGTKYRKIFGKVSNDDDDTLFSGYIWLDNPTPGDDWLCLWEGSQTDTQNDITGSETKYGCGILDTDVSAGGSTVIVTVENAALATGNDAIFRDGDLIGITNKPTPDSGTGTMELHTVTGAPSVNVLDVTLTIVGTLANAYTNAEGTRVFSVLEPGDVELVVGTPVATTVGDGTFDHVSYPVVGDNIGSENDTITLTFTDATNFNASGARLGSLGSGTTGGDFAPNNTDFTKPYFTVPYLGWTGTWASGDDLEFTLVPAAVPIWEKRVVPAAAASLSGNNAYLVFSGEAA